MAQPNNHPGQDNEDDQDLATMQGIVANQQAQIEDLTAVAERHQALFEKLARDGSITADDIRRR
jgi:hypothetical protein